MERNNIIFPVMNVVLRVPPLIIVDSLSEGFLRTQILEKRDLNGAESSEAFYVVALILVGMSSATIILLPTKQLINFYMFISLFGTVYTSYTCNVMLIRSFMHPEVSNVLSPFFFNFWIFLNKWTSLEQHSSNILALSLLQIMLAKLYRQIKTDLLNAENFSFFKDKTHTSGYKIYFLFVSPIVLLSSPANGPSLNFIPIVEIILAIFDMKPVFELLKAKFLEFQLTFPLQLMLVLRNEQFAELAANHWVGIQLPKALRTFCILQNMTTAAFHLNSLSDEKFENKEKVLLDLMQEMLEKSTRTYLSLVCLASILSLLACHVEDIFVKCIGEERQDSRWLSISAPILFLTLAIQTGLPVLMKSKRLTRLSYIFSLVFLSCLRHLHSLLHQKLIITALTPFSTAHVRHLLLNVLLMSLTLSFMNFQWHENLSVWSLSILAFGIELTLKIIVSLLIYGFTFADTRTQFAGDKADRYLYRIKFFGELIECFLGVFFFCNGVWMLLFESAGVLRAVVMCAHLYFNIWCKAKQLYTTCMKRKEASLRVGNLKSVLLLKDDVCAICFQDLQSGVVKETKCKHLFHEVCLCKWAFMSSKCPMCHRNAFDEIPP